MPRNMMGDARRPSTIADIAGKAKPFKDRAVDSQGVPCPICQAPVRQRCIGSQGTEVLNPHRPRRRMALRAGLFIEPTEPTTATEPALVDPGECPVCHAQVSTISYASARQLIGAKDGRAPKVRRIGRHKPGGGRAYGVRGGGPAIVCAGFGQIPA